MATRLALGFLTASSLAILLVLLLGLQALSWLFAVVVMGFPIALVAVAVSPGGRLGRVRIPLLVLLVMLQVGVIGVLAFSGVETAGPLGLPVSLHFLLVFVWLGPLVITTVSYAATFEDFGIDDALLERLEKMRVGGDDEDRDRR